MKNKFLSLLLAMAMLTATGCSKDGEKSEEPSSPKSSVESIKPSESEASSKEVAIDYTKKASDRRTIVDEAGNEVEIPTTINRVVITSILPLPSVYCLYNGAQGASKLVGMHPMSMVAAKNSELLKAFPEIANAQVSFVQNGEVNIEEIVKLNPDIVFYEAGHTEEKDLYDKANIPAVAFSTSSKDFNATETLVNRVNTLNDIYENDKKRDKIVKYAQDTEKEILEKTKDIEDEDKPRVLFLFHYADGTMKTSGKNFFGQYRIDTAGGVNVAEDLERSPEINMEQVYAWNPDMIFITNFSPVQASDILENKIEGDDRSKVKAVQEGKVYKMPMGAYRRFTPSADTPLTLKWMAKKIQPEVFKDLDIDQEIKDYYEEFYKLDLTDDDLDKMYNPAPEASGVVQKTDATDAK